MKKISTFKKFLIIYIVILALAIVAIDVFIWSKLSNYEKQVQAEQSAEAELKLTPIISEIVTPTATPKPTSTPVPTSSPTPTPTEVPKRTYVVEVPESLTVYVNGVELAIEEVTPIVIETDTFEVIYDFSETYKEYADIENKVKIPRMYSYEFQAPEEAEIIAKDANGIESVLELSHDKNDNIKYSSGFISDDSNYETISMLAFEAIEKYALFCTNDGEAVEMAPYFPEDSEYLDVISRMDNSWYMKHPEPPTFSEQMVLDYVGYSDSLVYIKITLKQTLFQTSINANKTTEITHPMWFIKLNGEWKIAAIEF